MKIGRGQSFFCVDLTWNDPYTIYVIFTTTWLGDGWYAVALKGYE